MPAGLSFRAAPEVTVPLVRTSSQPCGSRMSAQSVSSAKRSPGRGPPPFATTPTTVVVRVGLRDGLEVAPVQDATPMAERLALGTRRALGQ